MVLPGRNPVVLAKSIAPLDRLSGGRAGPGSPRPEHRAFAWRGKRPRFDRPFLMRRLGIGPRVPPGRAVPPDDVTIRPKPVQRPLGCGAGTGPRQLARVGRLCDGWLPSFCTPGQAEAGRSVVERVAAEHDRAIDPEHFGALLPYRPDGSAVPDALAAVVQARNPGADPDDVAPQLHRVPEVLGRFVDVGCSKFVVVPIAEPDDWRRIAAGRPVKPLEPERSAPARLPCRRTVA